MRAVRGVVTAVLAFAIAAMPEPARAQVVPADSTRPDSLRPEGVRMDSLAPATGMARLVPRSLVYALTRTTDTLPVVLGERSLELREAVYSGSPAWSLVEHMTGGVLPTLDDSLLLRRDDLAPLRWQSLLGSARLAAEFARDTMYAAVQGPAIRRSVTLGMPPGVVPNAGTMELHLQLAPLHDFWTDTLAILAVDLGGARVVEATMAVEGSGSVATPAGEWECWRVVLRAAGAEKRFWVRKADPLVVRTHQLIPGSSGQALEATLVGEVVNPSAPAVSPDSGAGGIPPA